MKIRVLAFGPLAEKLTTPAGNIEVPAGATALEAALTLFPGVSAGSPARLPFALAINTRYVRPDAVLAEGDVLALIPPVSGG